jgi:hypothetical protein
VASVDLVFDRFAASGSTAHLIFGASPGEDGPPLVEVTLAGDLSSLSFVAHIGTVTEATFAAALPDTLTFSAVGEYDNNVQRPIVAQAKSLWQIAQPLEIGHLDRTFTGVKHPVPVMTVWQAAEKLSASLHGAFDNAVRIANSRVGRFQDGVPVGTTAHGSFQNALRGARLYRDSVFLDGVPLRCGRSQEFQDGDRQQRITRESRFQDAMRLAAARYSAGISRQGVRVRGIWDERFQNARRPPPGIYMPPVQPPEEDLCYYPVVPAHLIFKDPSTGDTNLIFVCEEHDVVPPPALIVVPIRRVYMILNETTLKRVSDNVPVPNFGMNLSLDHKSWVWTFNTTIPRSVLPLVVPAGAGPVELEASVNGTVFRFYAERLNSDRSFGKGTVGIAGRGKAALLDAPYAEVQFFRNDDPRTANQLMEDVLTLSGVPIGWAVDYNAVDWLVPAGVFNHTGTRMSALNQLATSAGSYIQAHPFDQSLSVNLQYPLPPWEWDTVTPDIELPSAAIKQEGIEWSSKPIYNRVYVRGQQVGVLGQVTRGGTAGDKLAPMVIDPLMTVEAAARQRGIPILADTGDAQTVKLRMPLYEETGIIVPGKFIRYVDGAEERLGLSRSVNVDVGFPESWQTVSVETRDV